METAITISVEITAPSIDADFHAILFDDTTIAIPELGDTPNERFGHQRFPLENEVSISDLAQVKPSFPAACRIIPIDACVDRYARRVGGGRREKRL